VRFENIDIPYLNYTYMEGLYMLIFDLFLYVSLGLWLDKVFPKEYG
jgi:hypothetical protein